MNGLDDPKTGLDEAEVEAMGKVMTEARLWFQGKKAILGGSLLILAGVAGAFLGKLSPIDGLTLAAAGFSVCGFSAKANRHQSEILAALQSVATAGVDLRLGNKAGAIAAMSPVVTEAIQAAAPALSVHVSGDDPAVVLQAVNDLTIKQPAAAQTPGTGEITAK